MKELIDVRVAVCESSGCGKSQLVSKLHNYALSRPSDKTKFRLMLTEIPESGLPIFPEFDFALFAFEVTGVVSKWSQWPDIRDLISDKYSQYSSKTCLVGTKLDLVAPETPQAVEIRCLPTTVAYFARLKFLSMSSVTGAGIHDIALFIADQLFPLPPASTRSWRDVFEDVTSGLLDHFAAIFSLPVPSNINQDTEDTFEIPDDDTIDPLYETPECTAHNAYLSKFCPNGMRSPAYRITPTLIAKPRIPIEWDNTAYARSHLKISIPQPRYPHLKYWFVTDFIEGKSLLECWDALSFFMRFRIACTLRGYFAQMRRLTRSAPGSPVGGHVYGFLFSQFGSYLGPFESALTFRRFIEEVTYRGWKMHFDTYYAIKMEHGLNSVYPQEPTFPPSHYDDTLVFTHADISLSNIMLSDNGVLWIIDWGTCGFYPRWTEALGLYRYKNQPKSWQNLRWLMVGRKPKQNLFWEPYFLLISDDHGTLDPAEHMMIP